MSRLRLLNSALTYLTRLAEFDLYVGGGDTVGTLLSNRSNLKVSDRFCSKLDGTKLLFLCYPIIFRFPFRAPKSCVLLRSYLVNSTNISARIRAETYHSHFNDPSVFIKRILEEILYESSETMYY